MIIIIYTYIIPPLKRLNTYIFQRSDGWLTWTPGNPPVSTDTSLGKTSAILVTGGKWHILLGWQVLNVQRDVSQMKICKKNDL